MKGLHAFEVLNDVLKTDISGVIVKVKRGAIKQKVPADQLTAAELTEYLDKDNKYTGDLREIKHSVSNSSHEQCMFDRYNFASNETQNEKQAYKENRPTMAWRSG